MKRMEENRENKINKEAATTRENNGKASRIAKNILAAGLAAGGVAAFGDMSVFAAENEGSEVTMEMQEDTSAVVGESGNGNSSENTPAPASEPSTSTETPATASNEETAVADATTPAAFVAESLLSESPAEDLADFQAAAAPAADAPSAAPVAAAVSSSDSVNAEMPAGGASSETTENTAAGTSTTETQITEKSEDGVTTITETTTTVTYDKDTCTETKTEETTTTIVPSENGYDETKFGDRTNHEEGVNTDGSKVTTNEYTGLDGSKTTETITETTTPGTTGETVVSPSDGTEKDAVLVDQNGNPIRDENGNTTVNKTTEWEEKSSESTGTTTTTTYVAVTISKAASANEEGVDASLTEYYFTAIGEDGKAERVLVSGPDVKLAAIKNTDGTYTVTYGEGANKQTYILNEDAVKVSEKVADGASVTGKETENGPDKVIKVDESKTELSVTPNDDGSFSFMDVNGNEKKLWFAEGVVNQKEGDSYYYLTSTDGNEIRLPAETTGDSFDAVLNDDGETYTVTVAGRQYKVRAAGNKITSDTKYKLEGKDEKGASVTIDVTNKNSISVEYDTEKAKYKYTYQDENKKDAVLYIDSNSSNLKNIVIKVKDGEGTKDLELESGTTLPTPKWDEKDKCYKVEVGSKTYTVDDESIEVSVSGRENIKDNDAKWMLSPTTSDKVEVQVVIENGEWKEAGTFIDAEGKSQKCYWYSAVFKDKDNNQHTLYFKEPYVGHDSVPYYYIDVQDGNGETRQQRISKDEPIEYISKTDKTYTIRVKDEKMNWVTCTVSKDSVNETVAEPKWFVEDVDGFQHEVLSNSKLPVTERGGKYYVTITDDNGTKEIQVSLGKLEPVKGATTYESIYEKDANLAKISDILGDYGVTAESKTGGGHMDSNFCYGESSGSALGGSNNIYIPEGHSSGNTSYIGYVDGNVTKSGDIASTLYINLRREGNIYQDLVSKNDASAPAITKSENGQLCYVRTRTSQTVDGNTTYSYTYYEIQNYAEVIVTDKDIKTEVNGKLDQVATLAEELGKNAQTQDIAGDIDQIMDGSEEKKKTLDITGIKYSGTGKDVVYITLGTMCKKDGEYCVRGFEAAEQTTITMRENQILVLNIDPEIERDNLSLYKFAVNLVKEDGSTAKLTSDPKKVSESGSMMKIAQQIVFNFGNYAGKIKTAGSICGFIIAPNASVEMESTSSGRIAARSYNSGNGEWHFTGLYPEESGSRAYEYTPERDEGERYSLSPLSIKRKDCYVFTKAVLKPTAELEPVSVTTYKVTPSKGIEVIYYVVPNNHYEAKVEPQYYKRTTATKTVTKTSKTSVKQYVYRTNTTPEVPDVPTTPGTPETPVDPITPVSEEGAVLGVQRPQEIAEAAPSGGAVLGATRGRQVATGDEANVLASVALTGASGTGLGGFGLFRRLRNRSNRRNR